MVLVRVLCLSQAGLRPQSGPQQGSAAGLALRGGISVLWRPETPSSYADEQGPKHWSKSRFTHVMKLRQEASELAGDSGLTAYSL
ncbi:hypothetical protein CesoFtcFv8_014578 [Champsocephalus esox]|uniref:Uncharacterized protein n=1 Tax=Champsocephalus esox TaxID=159716 RepID=A0AAN8GR07_9TELE|nr:hypothetical protein CesoFtcFv8_014578 [Champsocephalus esox]